MESIVTKPMKVDFHIHSVYSKYKDEFSIVQNGDKKHINVLLNKLEDNNINMCAITDHDYFSYELYEKLKSYENKHGDLLKVFPGVEFSVGLKADDNTVKPVHVICIFDDSEENKEKISLIQEKIPFANNQIDYDVPGQKYFSEEKFINILREIDLNVIAIAHQKQSISSTSAKKSKNDVSSLGEEKFNELIACEYFESFEFKNMKNGMFNINFALKNNENYDQIRFITGSDCHDWNVYPKHDSKENSNLEFCFTYLKCLPTFRGLAMAFSDMRRISTNNNLFTPRSKSLDSIQIAIDNNNYDIKLSPGINVIIGDNSIGKSLLLHKITNYEYLEDKKIKDGYENYLKDNKIKVNTKLDKINIHTFDYQGSIREKFSKDKQDNSKFLKEKFPEDLNKEIHKMKIMTVFNDLFECLENKFNYDDKYRELISLTMVDEEVVSKNLSAKKISVNKTAIRKTAKLKNYYDAIIAKIDENYSLIEDDLEKKTIDEFKAKLFEFSEKYDLLNKKATKVYNVKTNMNNGLTNYTKQIASWKNELETKKSKFDTEDCITLSCTISDLVNLRLNQKSVSFKKINEKIEPSVLSFGEYLFIKKFKNCTSINEAYIKNVLNRVFKDNAKFDIEQITEDELKSMIRNYGDSNAAPLDVLKIKIDNVIDEDLESVPSITLHGNNVYSKLSSGMNSSIYFDILSTDQREGIYIVDQPEDDISQNSIKSNVLNNFKSMAKTRQIIMITHNPQFVVNLDVDNVICIIRDECDDICIQSGALEYVDKVNDVDILDTVAKSLDGGIESIRKRWKRYEKNFSFNKG